MYAAPAARSTVDTEKTVYLTFDDGPSARTPEILAVLKKYNVKATFFVVGKTDEQSKQWMRDIVNEGHAIGMHSYTHDYKKIYASPEAFLEDYSKIFNLIYEATGVYPQISRFPGGSINGYNGGSYENIISELVRRGFVYFDWNVATGDAAANSSVPVDTLVRNALSRIDSLRRAVVLMHDATDKKTTVEALSAIIEGYQKAGFTFAPLTPEVVPVVYTYPDFG
ncbi:MAG: polysaccharide deacetylase [Clostridia bacterium]|nr:polysaccharide deacetylase [Clostridia bacterium]